MGKSLLLFSGGIDSSVLAAHCKKEDRELHCLTVVSSEDSAEAFVSSDIAKSLGLRHKIINLASVIGHLSHLNMDLAVGGQLGGCAPQNVLPAPCSVELMHSVAEMYAVAHGIENILWAIHSEDVSDMSVFKEYLSLRERIISLRTGRVVKYRVPFISLTKSEIVRLGRTLGVSIAQTRSCSEKFGNPCGICDQCIKRQLALSENQVVGAKA